MISKLKKAGAALAVVAASPAAFAVDTGPDLSSLTSSISVGTVVTAVLAVGATMVGLYLAIKGAKTVLAMVKGA
jgi:hypothetical protein